MVNRIENTIDSVLKGIDLIENHLREDLSLTVIASESGYSYYHYSRIFQAITGHSPYDYVLRRRLSEAAKALVSTDKNIIEIAYDFAFKNPETFSRAFKRLFGIQPIQYRKSVKCHWHKMIMLDKLTLEHIKNRNYDLSKEPEITSLKAFSVTGVIRFVEGRKSSRLFRKEAIRDFKSERGKYGLKNPPKHYGITFSCSDGDDGFFYIFGGDSSEIRTTPGMICKPMPDAKYACFTHTGKPDGVRLTYDYIYGTWLPQSDYKVLCPLELENYAIDLSGEEDRMISIKICIPLSL